MNIIIAGFYQLWRAITQIWQLKQSLFYLIGYFLLGDSLNTTVTVIGTLQNEIVAYNTLQLTYLLIVGIAAQALGIWAFWNIQKRYGLSTKTMFNAVAVGIIVLDAWGMIGIWTQSFGFKKRWEVWGYQVFYGLFVCPWYSYSQTVSHPSVVLCMQIDTWADFIQDDIRSHSSRERVPFLLAVQHHWEDVKLHWTLGVECNHRRYWQ